MQTLFEYSGLYAPEASHSWGEVIRNEFYEGELGPMSAAEPFGVRIDKALEYPISLIQVTNQARINFCRSWHHIRADRVGVRAIWFIRRGAVEVVRSDGALLVKPGESAIVDSNVPFQMTAFADEHLTHQSVIAVVPAHLFLTHLPEAVDYRSAFTIQGSSSLTIAQQLLTFLCSDGDTLSGSTLEPLVTAFLRLIGDSIRQAPDRRHRQTCSDRRFSEIEAYVMKHLTDPDLSFYKVANCCEISPRYLSYLLKAGETSFSDLLWGRRLVKATEWLVSESMRDRMIQEIAFMAGYKSAAHFSRMFKSEHGCSPKDYRATRINMSADTGTRNRTPNGEG